MSGENCEKSVFLGTKRHPERYECELPEGHDGLHRAEAASHNFMTGSDDVLLHWQKVEDEDTAGDAIADDEIIMRSISGKGATKKELEEAAERLGDESEDSTELEPAACKVIREDGYSPDVYGTTWIPVSAVEEDDEILESAVQLSDMVSLLEKVEREAEAYTTAEEDPVTAFKHGSEFVLSNIRERLEEFTQNDREDIVECSLCGIRQYHDNCGGSCVNCESDLSQKGESVGDT